MELSQWAEQDQLRFAVREVLHLTSAPCPVVLMDFQ